MENIYIKKIASAELPDFIKDRANFIHKAMSTGNLYAWHITQGNWGESYGKYKDGKMTELYVPHTSGKGEIILCQNGTVTHNII